MRQVAALHIVSTSYFWSAATCCRFVKTRLVAFRMQQVALRRNSMILKLLSRFCLENPYQSFQNGDNLCSTSQGRFLPIDNHAWRRSDGKHHFLE